MLNTNPETVRRWIREGKLPATLTSRKNGNAISETALLEFLKASPKYSNVLSKGLMATMGIASSVLPVLGVSIAFAGLVGGLAGILGENTSHDNAASIDTEKLVKQLEREVSDCETSIEKKQMALKQLEEEINSEKGKIQMLNTALSSIQSNSIEIENKEDINVCLTDLKRN